MKFSIHMVVLIASVVVALPEPDWVIRREEEFDESKMTIVDLEVTYDSLPGRVFKGTAESIVNQVKEIDPSLLSNVTEDSFKSGSIVKRASINCSWGQEQVPQYYFCAEGLTYLQQLGGGNARCGVQGGLYNCARVSCSHDCGIYLCNRTSKELQVYCHNIPNDMSAIVQQCEDTFGRVKGAMDFANHYTGLASPRPSNPRC